jgi:hypothetical protein
VPANPNPNPNPIGQMGLGSPLPHLHPERTRPPTSAPRLGATPGATPGAAGPIRSGGQVSIWNGITMGGGVGLSMHGTQSREQRIRVHACARACMPLSSLKGTRTCAPVRVCTQGGNIQHTANNIIHATYNAQTDISSHALLHANDCLAYTPPCKSARLQGDSKLQRS